MRKRARIIYNPTSGREALKKMILLIFLVFLNRPDLKRVHTRRRQSLIRHAMKQIGLHEMALI